MKITMDSAGRLVIPKKIREEAGLKPGAVLDISCRDGQVEIQPATMRLRFLRRGPFVVAHPKKRQREAFTAETVEKTLDALREERAEGL
jgi:AbrB family looped-hinge helix DNA binding protein